MTELVGLVNMVDARDVSREVVFGNICLRSKADCENFVVKYYKYK